MMTSIQICMIALTWWSFLLSHADIEHKLAFFFIDVRYTNNQNDENVKVNWTHMFSSVLHTNHSMIKNMSSIQINTHSQLLVGRFEY
jgi:hypothetical protein